MNRRLLGGVNAGQVLLVLLRSPEEVLCGGATVRGGVFARGTGGSSGLASVVFKMADGGRKCHRVSFNSTKYGVRSTKYSTIVEVSMITFFFFPGSGNR